MISVVYRWGVNPLIIENRYDGILSRLLLLSHSAAVAFQFERPQRMTMLMAASYSSCYFIIILGGIAIKNQHYYAFAVSMKFFHFESNFDDLFWWKYAYITLYCNSQRGEDLGEIDVFYALGNFNVTLSIFLWRLNEVWYYTLLHVKSFSVFNYHYSLAGKPSTR